MALAHYHLARSVMGTRGTYAQFLAGATYFRRRGMAAPIGKSGEVLLGDAKGAGYRLSVTDFNAIGRTVLKAGEAMGIPRNARWVEDQFTDRYFQGVADGRFRMPVTVDRQAKPTTAAGDHPLDHWTGHVRELPREFRDKLRRATGDINRVWPEWLDVPPEQRPKPHQIAFDRSRVRTAPVATDWLFPTPYAPAEEDRDNGRA